jgi:pimeloyl-ACP methyl ester carboxylesterase
MTISSTRILRLALVLIALFADSARAQDQAVVFIHGLRATDATWADAAGRLESELAIAAYRPNPDWRSTFGDQAKAVEQSISGVPGAPIAIGHSNGGVVARDWSRVHPLRGLVTLGSPNLGAPIAYNILAWADFNFIVSDTITDLYGAFSDCALYSCGWDWVIYQDALNVYLYYLQGWLNGSLAGLATTVGVDLRAPVLAQMSPGSSYLSKLDSPDNVSREKASVQTRVGIVSEAHNFYDAGAFRAVWPEYGDTIDVIKDGTIFVLDYWAGYIYMHADLSDGAAFEIADDMSTVAGWLASLDPMWCEMVSYPGGGACTYNDTVVPEWSQVLPDAPVVLIGDGPAHVQETTSSDSYLYQVLTYYMNVPPRDAAGGNAPASGSQQMEPDSAIRECAGYVEWPAVFQPTAESCLDYCGQNGANACEWWREGSCYVEFGQGCRVYGGFAGWSAAVLGTPGASGSPPATVTMQSNSAVRGCAGYVEWSSVYHADAAGCVDYCAQNGADACEWFESGDCYVEFGSGCYVQSGFNGWSAVVFDRGGADATGTGMQSSSAVRGCQNYRESAPVQQQDAASCRSYCKENGADACEWSDDGFCYVEFGNGCYVEPGFTGWSAAVFQ